MIKPVKTRNQVFLDLEEMELFLEGENYHSESGFVYDILRFMEEEVTQEDWNNSKPLRILLTLISERSWL